MEIALAFKPIRIRAGDKGEREREGGGRDRKEKVSTGGGAEG